MSSVLQPWIEELTMMQQTVLLTAIRGPDGVVKEHVCKVILRWFRRCILISAMDKKVFKSPHEEGGGSFTGPLKGFKSIEEAMNAYLKHVDELPHHFQMHLTHAVEILGYKHPDTKIRKQWNTFYRALVDSYHLRPESEADMDLRLGDDRTQWMAREACVEH